MIGHDMIVVGASMGGIEATSRLVSKLAENFPASILVVQHTSPGRESYLGEILDDAGPLLAAIAVNGEEIVHGRIYVAPPDRHILVQDGRIVLSRGPKENRVRPAVDPLFRSAAVYYGPRTVGIVLSGYQDDGTAGLVAIKRCGGVAVIQNPDEAAYAEMPLHAQREDQPDYSLSIEDIGHLLIRLVEEPAGAPPPVPEDIMTEVKLTERVSGNPLVQEMPGDPTTFICPDCGGPLWEFKGGRLSRFRCLTGHSFTESVLMKAKTEEVERALWEMVRGFEERALLLKRLAKKEQDRGNGRSTTEFEKQAEKALENARTLKEMMVLEAV